MESCPIHQDDECLSHRTLLFLALQQPRQRTFQHTLPQAHFLWSRSTHAPCCIHLRVHCRDFIASCTPCCGQASSAAACCQPRHREHDGACCVEGMARVSDVGCGHQRSTRNTEMRRIRGVPCCLILNFVGCSMNCCARHDSTLVVDSLSRQFYAVSGLAARCGAHAACSVLYAKSLSSCVMQRSSRSCQAPPQTLSVVQQTRRHPRCNI